MVELRRTANLIRATYRDISPNHTIIKPAITRLIKNPRTCLVGNITDDILTGFSLDITTPMLTQAFRKDFVEVIKHHKGNIPLTIYLFDPQTRYRIQFYSKKFQVAVTSAFIQDLRRIGADQYEVLRK